MSKCNIFMDTVHLLRPQQINLAFEYVDCAEVH